MAIDRRLFLVSAAGFAVFGSRVRATPDHGPQYLAAAKSDTGYVLTSVSQSGDIVSRQPLPGRAHGIALRPDGRHAVIFARRPGSFACTFDLPGGETISFAPPDNRHFYGHGVFTADGRLLAATENDFETGAGKIGIYDAGDGYRRVGEYDTNGIGPHELIRRGRHLIVANGGIRTHPDMARQKLNLDTMRASVVWMDLRTGTIERQVDMPQDLSLLSLRHLSQAADGTVVVGGQWQGARADAPHLVWCAGPDEAGLRPVETVAEGPELDGYIGSVAVDAGGTFAAVTSPREGAVQTWHIASGRKMAVARMADVCGVAPTPVPGRFALSAGTGGVAILDVGGEAQNRQLRADIRFDNHMTLVAASR